jgi:hypothetical protein
MEPPLLLLSPRRLVRSMGVRGSLLKARPSSFPLHLRTPLPSTVPTPDSPPLSPLPGLLPRRGRPVCAPLHSCGSGSAMRPMLWPARSPRRSTSSPLLPMLGPLPPPRRDVALPTPPSSGTTRPTRSWLSFTTRPGGSRTFASSSRSSSSRSRHPTPAGGTRASHSSPLRPRRPRPR